MKNYSIDMSVAEKALTSTEFEILSSLYNKVKSYEIKKRLEQMIKDIDAVYGIPNTGKTSNLEEMKVTIIPIDVLLNELFGGFANRQNEENEVMEQIYRLKNQGLSDELISHYINKAVHNGKNVAEFLKGIE